MSDVFADMEALLAEGAGAAAQVQESEILRGGFISVPLFRIGGLGGTVNAFNYWARTTEFASGPGFARVDTRDAERRAVAMRFVRLARNIGGFSEAWLQETMPELEVSLVMREPDFDKEMALRGLFIDLMSEDLDPSVGELSIFAETDDVPSWVREGVSLT